MSGKLPIALALSIFATFAFAEPPRLAVTDFVVSSDNPALKFVGKGLAEMVAAELVQSKGVIVIDREKRAQLLGEQEFALSDAAGMDKQVEVGKLLSADYLLFGQVVDMGTAVLVSCKMVSVKTGEVVWTDKRLAPLSDYEGISRFLAASALKGLGADKAAAIAEAPKAPPKVEVAAARKQEAMIAFSNAVDSLDRKDTAGAKAEIDRAAAIDPTNAAVAIYAAKLAGGSPRFLVELDSYAPTYNPALLGVVDKLTIYNWNSSASPVGGDVGQYGTLYFKSSPNALDTIEYKESNNTNRIGAMLPLGDKLGLMAEYSFTMHTGNVGSTIPTSTWTFTNPGFTAKTQVNLDQNFQGANIGLGFEVAPGLGLGLSANVVYLAAGKPTTIPVYSDVFGSAPGMYFGATGGAAYRSPDGALSGDLELVWSNEPVFYLLSPPDGALDLHGGTLRQTGQPLLVSAGVTAGFFDQRLFANLRGIGEIGLDDRGYIAARAIPGIEWWPFKWLALRGACELATVSVQSGGFTGGGASVNGGFGFMGGATVSLWGFDLNFNYINRYRPLRQLPGAGHQDQVFFFGLSYSGLISR